MRIGMGYDVHRLVEGRALILGGVEIPYEKGLLGHSDADVLLHAVMDALLGAAALGDIGKHFPDTDPAYKGISSIKLLAHVGRLLEENLFLIENIDATIIAQAPKMRPHIDAMRENIAKALGITIDQVSIKATTEEGLGFTGTGEGISSQAICLLTSPVNLGCEDVTTRGCEGCKGCPAQNAKEVKMDQNTLTQIIEEQTKRALWEVKNVVDCVPDELWNKEYCKMPCWKHIYHMLHSLDLWYMNPRDKNFHEPVIHEKDLNNLDVVSQKVLSRKEIEQYFTCIEKKIQMYLSGLIDAQLLEYPPECEYCKFTLILAQMRHLHSHMGMIMGFIIDDTGLWPRVLGLENSFPDGKYDKYF